MINDIIHWIACKDTTFKKKSQEKETSPSAKNAIKKLLKKEQFFYLIFSIGFIFQFFSIRIYHNYLIS